MRFTTTQTTGAAGSSITQLISTCCGDGMKAIISHNANIEIAVLTTCLALVGGIS